MALNLKSKPAVKWEVVPELDEAQPIIAKVYKDHGAEATVTSGHDGKHSEHSAHKQNDPKALAQAIDLRIMNLFRNIPAKDLKGWYARILLFANTLEDQLNNWAIGKGCMFYVLVEGDHLHLELAYAGKVPNLLGYKPGKMVYAAKSVRGYLGEERVA